VKRNKPGHGSDSDVTARIERLRSLCEELDQAIRHSRRAHDTIRRIEAEAAAWMRTLEEKDDPAGV
jgi:hypothetical protein